MAKNTFSYVIVDDDETWSLTLKKLLSNYPQLDFSGYFTDSVSGLMGINRIQPDLLFLDWNIDTFKAPDIIETLETKPIIVLISSDPDIKNQKVESNVFAFLEKPISNQKKLSLIIRQITGVLQASSLMDSM